MAGVSVHPARASLFHSLCSLMSFLNLDTETSKTSRAIQISFLTPESLLLWSPGGARGPAREVFYGVYLDWFSSVHFDRAGAHAWIHLCSFTCSLSFALSPPRDRSPMPLCLPCCCRRRCRCARELGTQCIPAIKVITSQSRRRRRRWQINSRNKKRAAASAANSERGRDDGESEEEELLDRCRFSKLP